MKSKMILAAATLSIGLAGCATVEEAVIEKVADTYNATLTGSQEVGGGDPDGYAKAEISVADRLDQICYDVGDVRGIGPITAAHIHKGARGVNGPPVLTLKPAREGGIKGCEKAPDWLQDAVKTNFTGYYVNLHTAEFPDGAIRGQLGE